MNKDPKTRAGAIQQQTKIFASNAEIVANLIAIFVVETNPAQQLPVRVAHFAEYAADSLTAFASDGCALGVGLAVGKIAKLIRAAIVAAGGTDGFERHIGGNGVDESRQTRRIPQRLALAEIAEDSKKRLLIRIVDGLRRVQMSPKLVFDRAAENRDQVLFC
ncbi:MAG: hypothetical protein JO319_04365 [Acidobacteriaceae bacterium]|nr:hypothetical protein [Acidobacteriaceae bacterium]